MMVGMVLAWPSLMLPRIGSANTCQYRESYGDTLLINYPGTGKSIFFYEGLPIEKGDVTRGS